MSDSVGWFISGVRRVLSLPLLWAGQAACSLNSPVRVGLLRAAWAVGRQGRVGQLALAHLRSMGRAQEARALAGVWLTAAPRAEIASYAALLAWEDGDFQSARDLVVRTRALGDDPSGLADLVEYTLALEGAGPFGDKELLARMLDRRDLSPFVSKLLLINRLWISLLEGQFDQAESDARRALAIEPNPQASIALWALSLRAGRPGHAAAHLRRAGGLDLPGRLFHQAIGSFAIGRREDAERYLEQLREHDPAAADRLRQMLPAEEGAP